MGLPATLSYSWKESLVGELAEADAAESELAHMRALSSALPASSNDTG